MYKHKEKKALLLYMLYQRVVKLINVTQHNSCIIVNRDERDIWNTSGIKVCNVV